MPVPDTAAAEALAAALQLTGPAARVLCARGYGEAEAARRFLWPAPGDLHDPFLMRDMARAVERLRRAIAAGERILIYGDYDVDGAAAVAILTKAIEMAGGHSTYHVPHRLRDGYGMRPEVIEEAAAAGVGLIVSVDTGIRAGEVVRRATELGMDVIVTDHHLPEAELPPAWAVLNPCRTDCGYPEKNLCGAGVAFKLAQALVSSLGWPAARVARVAASFLRPAAIATVADVVPLTGENRVIAKHGLAGLASVRSPGLRALLEVAGIPAGTAPTARQVAFHLAPRLNAAGRMATAEAAVELLLTSDVARARELARQLHEHNADRQQVEARIRAACEEVAVSGGERGLVYYGEDWHRGVLGIVAGRLAERHWLPVFVLGGESGGMAQGSGRSIPAFHLMEALEAMPDLFLRFGGHSHAAGVTLEAARVDEFRRRFNAYAAGRLRPEDLVREYQIDAVVDPGEIDEASVAGIQALAPFGHGNQAPWLAALDVEVVGPPVVFGEKHLRVTVRRGGRALTLKAWNQAGRAGELVSGARVDVAFTVEEGAYVLRDFRTREENS
jgi:single-stranded-DNA-specific exonuclease